MCDDNYTVVHDTLVVRSMVWEYKTSGEIIQIAALPLDISIWRETQRYNLKEQDIYISLSSSLNITISKGHLSIWVKLSICIDTRERELEHILR